MKVHAKYPYDHVNVTENDFYLIPMSFNNYAINIYGKVVNLTTLHTISISVGNTGYPNFRVWDNGRNRLFRVHRVLAEIFLPHPTFPEPVVNHINGIKTDNSIANLEWVTMRGNLMHALRTGLNTHARQVVITDLYSGIATPAPTIKDACVELEINYKRFHRSMRAGGKPYQGRWVADIT